MAGFAGQRFSLHHGGVRRRESHAGIYERPAVRFRRPTRQICTPGFAWGGEFKKSCRLGEGTDVKASATVRLRKGYRFKARLYHPRRSLGSPVEKTAGSRDGDRL
jgi:hypothetical protein